MKIETKYNLGDTVIFDNLRGEHTGVITSIDISVEICYEYNYGYYKNITTNYQVTTDLIHHSDEQKYSYTVNDKDISHKLNKREYRKAYYQALAEKEIEYAKNQI